MKNMILVLLALCLMVLSSPAENGMTDRLMDRVSQAITSQAAVETIIQLRKDVRIMDEDYFPNGLGVNTYKPDLLNFSNFTDNSTANAGRIIQLINTKSANEVVFFQGPDRNGQLQIAAIPAVLMELAAQPEVLTMDVMNIAGHDGQNLQGPAEIPFHLQPLEWSTSTYQGTGVSGGAAQLMYSGKIAVGEVPWIRLIFADANLGNNSYVAITSLLDGGMQILNSTSMGQWQYTSAYFNGNAVSVELFVAPGDEGVFLSLDNIIVGEWANGSLLESICGPTDDRIPSNDPAVGRVMSIGCTGWIIASGIHVTAGHCLGGGAAVLQFNVPLSLPNGTTQNPPPEDQYSIDINSQIGTGSGIGNDWGVFTVFDNSNTGLQPIVAQGAAFIMAQDYLPDSIRITGYGVDDGTANQTQQTHYGPNAGSSGTTMRYRTDTTGGNSGSPVIDWLTGFALGVHTHGGCNSTGGNNSGTSTYHPDFWAQVSSAAGIPPLPPDSLTAYSDYTTPTSINLEWVNPTQLINGTPLLTSEYTIQIDTNGVWLDSLPGGTTQYTSTGLNDGQEYTYVIYARLDSMGWESDVAEVSWTAGGSPVPNPPTQVGISTGQNQITLYWRNPADNIDGTPMDDFDAINLYMDDNFITSFTRSAADTGMLDSSVYSVPSGEFHRWHLTALDNETPQNESTASQVVITPVNIPQASIFNTTDLPDSNVWHSVDVDVNDRSLSPPSAPYALNFNGKPNGTDSLVLYPTDLSGYNGSGLMFSYHYQPEGQGNAPEQDDSLKVEFLNSAGEWILVRSYPGSTVQPFTQEVIDLENEPSGSGIFLHSQFQLRISCLSDASPISINDDWFVDNIYLGLPSGLAVVSMDSLVFDTTQVGSMKDESLWVVNMGFDSLRVSNILLTNSVFGVTVSSFTLGVGDSQEVVVSFSPTQPGVESGLVRMLSDGAGQDTLDVYVEGEGVGVVGILGDESLPRRYEVSQNYPNPFNPVTAIHYELPRASEVSLSVYNLLGQKVRTLVSGYQSAGRYNVEWQGNNDNGIPVGSGVYIYRFEAGDYQRTLKMILMK